jgi:hypothetical protein
MWVSVWRGHWTHWQWRAKSYLLLCLGALRTCRRRVNKTAITKVNNVRKPKKSCNISCTIVRAQLSKTTMCLGDFLKVSVHAIWNPLNANKTSFCQRIWYFLMVFVVAFNSKSLVTTRIELGAFSACTLRGTEGYEMHWVELPSVIGQNRVRDRFVLHIIICIVTNCLLSGIVHNRVRLLVHENESSSLRWIFLVYRIQRTMYGHGWTTTESMGNGNAMTLLH